MTRVVKVLTAAAKNKWKQRARRRELRQRTGYDGPVNLPIGNYRSTPFPPGIPFPRSNMPSLTAFLACTSEALLFGMDSRQSISWLCKQCMALPEYRHGVCPYPYPGHTRPGPVLAWSLLQLTIGCSRASCPEETVCVLRCSPGIAAAMARVHSYEWVQDALLDGQEDDDGEHASHACLHASHKLVKTKNIAAENGTGWDWGVQFTHVTTAEQH